jgi:hypothetical protein
VVALRLQEAMDQVASGQIQDAKTIVALQHLALRKLSSARAGHYRPDGPKSG